MVSGENEYLGHPTLDYGISMPDGINMPGGTFSKTNKHASWKIALWCWKIALFLANDTFLNKKIVIL